MRWVLVSPGRSGIHAKLISSGQKEKDKHGFEGRPPLTLLKNIPAPAEPLPATLCSNGQFALSPERGSGHAGGHPADPDPTPTPAPGQPREGPAHAWGPRSRERPAVPKVGAGPSGVRWPTCADRAGAKGAQNPRLGCGGAGRAPKLRVCSQSRKTRPFHILFLLSFGSGFLQKVISGLLSTLP